ncbi:hypothetical protein M422DRAFT_41256 [Sphaerobolus stellatus SS14]|nr:hypothetical protein M422DRAFT_41256 [Sphaerobolus stellatus SS14]
MTMTLNATAIRSQLAQSLGQNGRTYWRCLSSYLKGEIPRYEFDESIRECINTPELAHLHNSLIIALLSSATLNNPPPPPPDIAKTPRKRGSASERARRLKHWAVGMGKRERERVKALEVIATNAPSRPRRDKDEISLGRAVKLLHEGRDPPGTHLPQHLCSLTRTITQQNIAERIALISAQNNLGPPNKAVSQLVLLALEAKLKHLVANAISLTSTSRTVSSIQIGPSSSSSVIGRTLSGSSFDTLFTVAPAVLPYSSAAALRLSLGENDYDWQEDNSDKSKQEERQEDPRAIMMAALRKRAAIKGR